MFTSDTRQESIEVRFEDEMLWLTQKLMAELFGTTVPNINTHISSLLTDGEITEYAVIKDFLITAVDGKEYRVKHYNLDAIIAVGFRVNSERAAAFRKWAIDVLKEFSIKGFVLDKKRLENGSYLGIDYFEALLEEIREIRASERRFYQKITDIYATAFDYDPKASFTQRFFQTVQNKLHFAIHGYTAAELIMNRADADKPHMALTTWSRAPKGKIIKSDVTVAKNYLTEKELTSLNRIVTMYLDYAEAQAERGVPMSMMDWGAKLDAFLQFNEREILDHPGKITAEIAKTFAEGEFEKFRVKQDKLYESDFDREIRKRIGKSVDKAF